MALPRHGFSDAGADLWNGEGVRALVDGNLSRAHEILDVLESSEDDRYLTLVFRGNTFEVAGRSIEAHDAYSLANAIDPEGTLALTDRGDSHAESDDRGDLVRAEKLYSSALALLRSGRFDLDRGNEQGQAYLGLVRCKIALRCPEEAARIASVALRACPDWVVFKGYVDVDADKSEE